MGGVRIKAGVKLVKSAAVIVVDQMRDFVGDDIVAHERRGEDKAPAIGNARAAGVVRTGTTAPAAGGIGNANRGRRLIDLCREGAGGRGKIGEGFGL